MPNQTIPITLQWGPTSQEVAIGDINAFGDFVAAHLAGTIRADVTFILTTLTDPTTFVTDLIFNTTQGVFKYWSSASGSYIPVTPFAIGDLKTSLAGADTIATGWVLLNGRTIASIPGLSTAQSAVLMTLFPSGTLPVIVPQNFSAFPVNGSFSAIPAVAVTPADGVIAALPFDDYYVRSEVEALRDDTETLRDSTAAVQSEIQQVKSVADSVLAALNNSTPPLYSLVFIGFS